MNKKMSNIEKLKEAFVEGLEIPMEEVEAATMESVDKWDSIGQMSLVAIIEDAFGIEFEPDEVMQFTSFEAGKEILKNHNIEF
jgi:acyl carrier protein